MSVSSESLNQNDIEQMEARYGSAFVQYICDRLSECEAKEALQDEKRQALYNLFDLPRSVSRNAKAS